MWTEEEKENAHRPFDFAQDRLKPVLLGGLPGPSVPVKHAGRKERASLRVNWKPALPRPRSGAGTRKALQMAFSGIKGMQPAQNSRAT
jgi:hypothetical protein